MQRAPGLGLVVVALALCLAPAALAANAPPKLVPIQATFDEKAFATTYAASATDPDGDKLTLSWQLSAPAQDPNRNAFATLAPAKAIWHNAPTGVGTRRHSPEAPATPRPMPDYALHAHLPRVELGLV